MQLVFSAFVVLFWSAWFIWSLWSSIISCHCCFPCGHFNKQTLCFHDRSFVVGLGVYCGRMAPFSPFHHPVGGIWMEALKENQMAFLGPQGQRDFRGQAIYYSVVPLAGTTWLLWYLSVQEETLGPQKIKNTIPGHLFLEGFLLTTTTFS